MAVMMEFEVGNGFHFATAFAQQFDVPVMNDQVNIPEQLGDGFIQEIYLSNGLALCIHNYTLKQELVLKRLKAIAATDTLIMKFDCSSFPDKIKGKLPESLFTENTGWHVEFGSGNFFSQLTVPPNKAIIFVVISSTRSMLLDLLKFSGNENWIKRTLDENNSFFVHESMSQEMEQALKQLTGIKLDTMFSELLYQTKALELIYFLFSKLLSRAETTQVTINIADAEKIYEARAIMLADISITPLLPALATKIGMSLSKMKQLFNQIFGKSIYEYYQAERMNHASFLLHQYSVSEAGYKVGFSNLSHFTRLFERYHHLKPKQFKNSLKSK